MYSFKKVEFAFKKKKGWVLVALLYDLNRRLDTRSLREMSTLSWEWLMACDKENGEFESLCK